MRAIQYYFSSFAKPHENAHPHAHGAVHVHGGSAHQQADGRHYSTADGERRGPLVAKTARAALSLLPSKSLMK